MACPDEEHLLLDELGELKVHDSRALAEHAAGCPACRARREAVGGLLRDLGEAARDLPDDGGAFRARVLAAMAAPAARSSEPVRRPRLRLALAAAAAVMVPAVLLIQAGRFPDLPGERLTARGPGGPTLPRAEVLLVRTGKLLGLAGQAIGPADALAVRVGNGSDRDLYLLAFGRDAAGEVHWLYPAYRDPDSDPAALRIDRQSPARVLDELVLPERPAAGRLRLATVLAPGALTVKQVERLLAAAPPDASFGQLFPDAIVAEWTARWEETK